MLLYVVVVSTSLLIYVVLYKNELLSNLYVLLKVLCFAILSSSSSAAFFLSRIVLISFTNSYRQCTLVCLCVFVFKYYKSLYTPSSALGSDLVGTTLYKKKQSFLESKNI